MNESQFLKKVLAVVQKQQAILKKLAQAPTEDVQGNISFLKGVWQTAGLNSGVESMSTPQITHVPGSTTDTGVNIEGSYNVSGAIPEHKRELFARNFSNQIKSQKPELDGKVNTFYQPVGNV